MSANWSAELERNWSGRPRAKVAGGVRALQFKPPQEGGACLNWSAPPSDPPTSHHRSVELERELERQLERRAAR